jgi:hypothetical protein
VNIDFNTIGGLDTNEPTFGIETTPTPEKPNTTCVGITLKKHKDVLFEMYKVAKRKAIEAKRVAIRAYLEAKEIKASYLLDNSDLSDSDSDNN